MVLLHRRLPSRSYISISAPAGAVMATDELNGLGKTFIANCSGIISFLVISFSATTLLPNNQTADRHNNHNLRAIR